MCLCSTRYNHAKHAHNDVLSHKRVTKAADSVVWTSDNSEQIYIDKTQIERL